MNKASPSTARAATALQDLVPDLLAFLADPARFDTFTEATGIGANDLRSAAADTGFAQSLFDYVCADEARLTAFAAETGHALPALDSLRQRLAADAAHEPWS